MWGKKRNIRSSSDQIKGFRGKLKWLQQQVASAPNEMFRLQMCAACCKQQIHV
jgi:hypothetical protein